MTAEIFDFANRSLGILIRTSVSFALAEFRTTRNVREDLEAEIRQLGGNTNAAEQMIVGSAYIGGEEREHQTRYHAQEEAVNHDGAEDGQMQFLPVAAIPAWQHGIRITRLVGR